MRNLRIIEIILSIMIVELSASCNSDENIAEPRSGYSVEHRWHALDLQGTHYGPPMLELTIRGKAAKIAVLLIEPGGETRTEIISEENMIDNFETATFSRVFLKPGAYEVVIKTFTPEKIVYKKKIEFKRGNINLEDANIAVYGQGLGGRKVEIGFLINNEGDLPVMFDKLFLTVEGQTSSNSVNLVAMPGRNQMKVFSQIIIWGIWQKGNYLVTGKLEAVGGDSFLTFQKKTVFN